MKKLMIAAAAVAMIGAASAGTVYDFTASLKSTVGKYVAAKKVTTAYYLGANDDASKMWYQDPAIQGLIADDTNTVKYFSTKTISGNKIPCLSSAAKKDYAWLDAFIVPLATTDKNGKADDFTYGRKNGGKWCEQFSITVQPDDGMCYRVAGTIKVKGEFTDDCCLTTATPDILNYFGAASSNASKKVELYMADATSVTFDEVEITDSTKNERTLTALAIAGQGANGTIITGYTDGYDTERGVTSISGYAVGTADAPQCTSCCVVALDSACWQCDGTDYDGDTAVYGSFSIKYNASKTKKAVNP